MTRLRALLHRLIHDGGLNAEFTQLLEVHFRWAGGHEVVGLVILREGNDFADRAFSGYEHRDSVEAESYATMGRGSEGEGF